MKKNKVILGVVVFNEEEKIKKVLENIEKTQIVFPLSVVFVNDHSTDNSPAILQNFVKKHKNAALINNAKNYGVGKSIRNIITYGRKHDFAICAIMAGNGKDNPLEVRKLVKPIIENSYDYIQGSRFLDGGSFNNLPLARKLMIKGFTFITWIFTGFWGTDATNGFRAYKLSLFNDKRIDINQSWLNRYEFETYLHYRVITLGYKVGEVPVSKNYLKAVKSYSKIRPFIDWWKMLRPLFFLKLHIKN